MASGSAVKTSAPRKQRITLFGTVLSLFLIVALLVGSAVTVSNYLETRRTAVKVAADTFQSTIGRINEQRFAFFTPAYLLTTILRNAPSFQTSDGSKEAIRQLILTSLKGNPQISAAYVGYENGNFFHFLSIAEGEKAFVEQLGGPPLTRFVIQEIVRTPAAPACRPGCSSTKKTVRSERSPGRRRLLILAAAAGTAMPWSTRRPSSGRCHIASRPRRRSE